MVRTMKAAGCDPMAMCKEMMEQKQAGDRAAPSRGDGQEGRS
ncbi:MAG TPA: hypothetical protein VK997_15015 [Deferrisomatales bacterium]|nr:hypothetical protein [Deferrisomatales bacterium]